MTRFGYTLMTEQSGPKQLVDYAVSAERVGFDFEVSSDHYSPWPSVQGHAGQIPVCWIPTGTPPSHRHTSSSVGSPVVGR
jgi:alkanesulfonate monooxygenase SsuD/methylene tetrahydromethanopterin reductase-like flavin-dependent oxidoreductase (luciferase family)